MGQQLLHCFFQILNASIYIFVGLDCEHNKKEIKCWFVLYCVRNVAQDELDAADNEKRIGIAILSFIR